MTGEFNELQHRRDQLEGVRYNLRETLKPHIALIGVAVVESVSSYRRNHKDPANWNGLDKFLNKFELPIILTQTAVLAFTSTALLGASRDESRLLRRINVLQKARRVPHG